MKKYLILSAITLCMFAGTALAQLMPMGTSYYQNLYINNPALAGHDKGMTLNLALRKQFTTIPGAPVNQALTAEYGFGNKTGAGINIYNDLSGLLRTTRAVASYSYYLQFREDRRLHFGISAGMMNQRIDMQEIDGDDGDLALADYNRRETFIDGDFGMAYTTDRLNAQLALPQLKELFGRDRSSVVNYTTFFTSLSYRFRLGMETEGLELEPKLIYRGIRGSENVVDAGVNLLIANRRLNLFGMYNSEQNFTFGLGLNYKTLTVSGMYATGTATVQSYTRGDFELGLKLGLFGAGR